MGSRRTKSKPRQMRKIALVICEGESERYYLNLLKGWYKSPIKILHHIEGTKICPELVEERINEHKLSAEDIVYPFLMYDLDVVEINEKIFSCNLNNLGFMTSNPCFELWLLLHFKEQRSKINSENVVKELKKVSPSWNKYEKARFTETQKAELKKMTDIAIIRAKGLKEFDNPSSGIYKLIELLRK